MQTFDTSQMNAIVQDLFLFSPKITHAFITSSHRFFGNIFSKKIHFFFVAREAGELDSCSPPLTPKEDRQAFQGYLDIRARRRRPPPAPCKNNGDLSRQARSPSLYIAFSFIFLLFLFFFSPVFNRPAFDTHTHTHTSSAATTTTKSRKPRHLAFCLHAATLVNLECSLGKTLKGELLPGFGRQLLCFGGSKRANDTQTVAGCWRFSEIIS